MRKGRFLLLGLGFISLAFFSAAWAEEVAKTEIKKDYQVFDLGEIFITSEKPPAVQEMVITNEVSVEDIKATNSRTVAEALAFVPGIRVSTGRKNEPLIQIHGIDQSRILLLIDGVPYYETNYGKLDPNQIPVDNIAKIEVTKGAASVLYGPNALVGVINIITKKPVEKPSAEALFEMGPHDTSRISVSHGMKVGIFNYWLNYGHRESDGWRLSRDFSPVIGSITNRPGPTVPALLEDGGYRNNSDYNTDSFWAKVGIEPNPGSEFYVNSYYISKNKGTPPSTINERVMTSFPAFSQLNRITRYDDWGIDLSGQQKVFDPLTLKGKLFYHNHTDDYTSFSDPDFTVPLSVSRFRDYYAGGILLADLRPVEWDTIRLSFHYKGDSHKERADVSLPFQENFSYTGSIGLENEFNLIGHLSIVAGASYDWFRVSKANRNIIAGGAFTGQTDINKPDKSDEFDPMIGLTYLFPDTTRLFGSIARKVRFPTLQQLFSSSSGNLDLKAERAVNYTLGVSRLFSNFAKAELAGFCHDLRDFISRDAPALLSIYQNFAKIRMLGFELNGELYPMKDLILRAGYTYNNAKDKSPDRATDDVVNAPAHKVDAGVTYTIPYINTRLDLVGIYMGRIFNQLPTPRSPTQATVKVKDYYFANARVSTSFLKYFEVYLALNNILDEDYESETGFPGPGRSFYAGISAKY